MGRRRVRNILAPLALLAMLLMGCGLLPGEPEITMEFRARDEVLPPGGCTILHWQVEGAGEYPVFLNGERVDASGDEEVCLEATQRFELVVGAPGEPREESLMIQVEGEGPAPEPPPGEEPPEGGVEALVFEAHPDTIPQGGCAILFWEVVPPADWPVFLNGEPVPPAGEREECPEGTMTYELFVEAPGGPQERSVTLHVEGEPAPPPAPATQPPPTQQPPTQPPPTQPPPTQPPPTQPPPTPFVPRWGQCSWVKVAQGGINSHQPVTWCPNGSFVTGLDLDREGTYDPLDSPVVGQAHCCPLSVGQFSNWGGCSWVGVLKAGVNSHQPETWCPDGSYVTGLDLDRGPYDPLDSPVVGQAQCCPMAASQYVKWSSCSWVKVEQAGINSHQPVTWCPNGSFVAGLDLDRAALDPLDSPVVGQALCCNP